MASVAARIDPFADHVSIMKALFHEYQKKDDFDNVAYINRLVSEIQQMCVQRENTVKDLIREQQFAAVQERLHEATSRSSELSQLVASEEPKLRHRLSLFAHISKITWRLDQEDHILGSVSDPKSGDIRPIDIDPAQMSQFEAVNKLWELL